VRPLICFPPEVGLPGERLSQEAKCFSVGQRVMSSPDLGDDFESRVGVDAIDPGEVDARDAMEVLASIEAGIGPSGLPLAGLGRQGLATALILQPSELGLDFVIAGGDLLLVEVDEFRSLTELEEVLGAPGALQRTGDRRLVGLAAAVAELGELVGVSLTVEDGPDNGHPGHAGDVLTTWASFRFICSRAFGMCWIWCEA
jgi:hypothetical protein